METRDYEIHSPFAKPYISVYSCVITALTQPRCAPCMMAAGVVRAAIASILQDKDFELNTPRMVVANETAQMLLDVSTGDDMGQDSFAITLATPTSSKQFSTNQEAFPEGSSTEHHLRFLT